MIRSQEIIIEVRGMVSDDCERRVAMALREVPGVEKASANRHEGHALVTADPAVATPNKLREAVNEAGCEPGEVLFPE
jgi:copper chaperone CopZ